MASIPIRRAESEGGAAWASFPVGCYGESMSGSPVDSVHTALLAHPGWQRLSIIDEVRWWVRFTRQVVGADPYLAEDLDLVERYLDGQLKRSGIRHRVTMAERRLRQLDDESASRQELTLLLLDDHLLDGTAQDVDNGDFLWHLRQVRQGLDQEFLHFVHQQLEPHHS